MTFMFSALKRQGCEVSALGPVLSGARISLRCADILTRAVLGKSYDYRHSFLVAKEYAYRFGRKLRRGNFDVIFAPAASSEISLLETGLPIVYLSDVLFADYQGYHPNALNLLHASASEGDRIERLALRKSAAFICPSAWTARCAKQNYGMRPESIRVLPFGANLERIPTHEEATRRKGLGTCRLLFLGVNWERKGGPIALETLQLLLAAGIDAELVVCGCVPPARVSHPKLTVIPFLSKREPSHIERLVQLLQSANFLILPTQADAFGIVFCEASSFGLPSIARNTGGVGGAITDGVNGYKLAPEEGAEAYARVILKLIQDPEAYHALCVSSRREYEQRLNWDAWGRGAKGTLEDVALRCA
jgi:glycosyltransferase involved in cell wall biosynthesis